MRTFIAKLFVVILPIFVFGGVTISCTNDLEYDFDVEDVVLSEQPQSPHHIPLSEALGNLESMMSEMGMDNTRALQRGRWTVKRIPLSAFKSQTRSGGEAETSDAIYVVNFDNDEGFAILSADDRLPDDVIAFGPRGSIDIQTGPITEYDDYLTLEDLYVPEDDDYLLGSKESDMFIGGLVTNYVMGWIDTLGGATDDDGRIPINPPPPSDRIRYTYDYQTVEHIPEMLTTTWHQRSPFNDQCPNRHYYKGFLGIEYSTIKPYDFDAEAEWGSDYIRDEDLAAGCVAIAVAQILAYNKFPSVGLVINESDAMPWDSLIMNKDSLHSVEQIRQSYYLAKMAHRIGVGCDMKYGFWSTKQSFATPAAAARYLKDVGYSNTDAKNYNFSEVKSMLDNNLPVFVGALRLSGDVGGHAWVLDGYRTVYRITTGTNSSGNVVSTTTDPLRHYVHCNWGWDGVSDGWFANSLLENKYIEVNDAESFDDPTKTPYNYYYDHWFRMIEYNK